MANDRLSVSNALLFEGTNENVVFRLSTWRGAVVTRWQYQKIVAVEAVDHDKENVTAAERQDNFKKKNDDVNSVREPLRTLASKNLDNITAGPCQKTVKINKSEVIPAAVNSNYNIQKNESSRHSTTTLSRLPFEDLNEEYVRENMEYLLMSEKKVGGETILRKASRTSVVNWIININEPLDNCAIVQTACWYLDKYASVSLVATNKLYVTAAACFWIGNKLVGKQKLVVTSQMLVEYSEKNKIKGRAFTKKDLIKAEQFILKKLRFQPIPVVADDFVSYLSYCCDESGSGLVEAATKFICQCGIMMEKLSYDYYPSVIAAAAVLTALELLKKNDWKDKLRSCPVFHNIQDKVRNINNICTMLHKSVHRVVSSQDEYSGLLNQFSGPPHYISIKIVQAIRATRRSK